MRGIIFRDDMIRAILEGHKTQTRRTNRRWLRIKRGDLLYAKETWCLLDRHRRNPDKPAPLDRVVYKEQCRYEDCRRFSDPEDTTLLPSVLTYRWRNPLYMPEKYARLYLQVTASPQIERIQDISDDDARAEGVQSRDEFRALWEEIHPEGWEENPEVVVIYFREVANEQHE